MGLYRAIPWNDYASPNKSLESVEAQAATPCFSKAVSAS